MTLRLTLNIFCFIYRIVAIENDPGMRDEVLKVQNKERPIVGMQKELVMLGKENTELEEVINQHTDSCDRGKKKIYSRLETNCTLHSGLKMKINLVILM